MKAKGQAEDVFEESNYSLPEEARTPTGKQ